MSCAMQLMLYQVIPGTALTSSQLPDGVAFSTALHNEYTTVRSNTCVPFCMRFHAWAIDLQKPLRD